MMMILIEKKMKKMKSNLRKGKYKRKSFISNNISSSKDSFNEDSEEEENEALFMGLKE